MGNQSSSPTVEESFDVISARTKLSLEELSILKEQYNTLSGSITQDGVIDMAEFQACLGFKEAVTAARLFNCLDSNGDKKVDFSEFATGIAICAGKLGLDAMIKLSFKLYDLDSNGYIDRSELLKMLKAAMMESATLELNEKQMSEIVDQTFSMVAQHPDRITMEEYSNMVHENHSLLSLFSVDVAQFRANKASK
jgi:serine/threonine-protein phosphatase 2B regulatory subunit